MTSDTELMLAFRDGDMDGFNKLVKRHQVALINFFYKMIWDRSQAEDLTQEVFLRLYLHRADYEARAKFTTFLYRVARNCAVDHLRKSKHERKVKSLDAETDEGRSLYHEIEQQGETPVDSAGKGEFTEAIISAIQSLPEEHRIVFIFAEVKGMKYAEISEVLNVPVGTVKSRMHNATKKLRDKLVHVRPHGAARANGV